ncbi:MAG TPA: tetratricopeptide repeat protein [Gemmatimonadaceae bacterium]
MSRRHPLRLGWLAVFLVAAVAGYASAIRAPFEFDDLPAIQQNQTIRSLSPAALLPPSQTAVAGRPLVNVSLALNYAINDALGVDQRGDPDGPNKTVGYHVLNLLLHVACGLLLFGIVRRTIDDDESAAGSVGAERVAGFAVLLWLVHPIQTDAVDYVIQRTEILVSLCYAATLYAAIRAWDSKKRSVRWCVASVVACSLGMASKEVMITAPLVVLLYDRTFRAESWTALWQNRQRRRLYVALVATGLIVLVSILAGVRSQSVGFGLGVTGYQYFYTQGWAIARYLRLLVWPSGLTFDYGERPVAFASSIPGLVLLTACAIGTVVAFTRKRWMWLGFLGAWFFLLLAPSSSVVPIKTEIAAERRIYLASAAIFVLVAIGAERLARRYARGLSVERVAFGILAAALVAITAARGLTYCNSETLYRDVIAKAPDNPRGYVGVGLAHLVIGPASFADASAMFRKAIEVDSNSSMAWRSLALMATINREWPSATASYRRVLTIDSTDVGATDGIARALLMQGETDAAIPYVERMGSADLELLWSLGDRLVALGRGKEAVRYLEVAANSEVPSAENLALLSHAYAQSGRVDDAEKAAAVATASAGDTAAVFVTAWRAMVTANRVGQARRYLQQALAIDSTLAGARRVLDSLSAIHHD